MKYSKQYWNDVERVVEQIQKVENLRGKKFLITGASGLIGSSIADILFYLNQSCNYKMQIFLAGRSKEKQIERFVPFIEGRDYIFVKFDATEDMKLKIQADYIIHGASNADPKSYVEQPVETMLANMIGTNTLLKYAKENRIERLLYISSSEVYGKKTESCAYKENDYGYVDITNPRACYPCSKRAAETLCVAYGIQYGIDTVIVRPGHIYGPAILESDSRASAQFTRSALNGENIVMKSSGRQLRSYCYTLDCASAILSVLLNGRQGQAYNISNKNSIVSIRDVAEALAKYAGTKVDFENPSDKEKKGYNLMDNSSLNAEKLENLGWNACFDLEQGIERTICNLK